MSVSSGENFETGGCAFYIGLSPAPYFLAGLISTMGLLAIAFRLYRDDNTIERGGMKSIDWFLPIYIQPIGYVITVSLIFGVANMLGVLQLDLSCSIVKWFINRVANEGLAVFLMHNGIGQRPYTNALRISFVWALMSSLASFLLYFLLGVEPYFIGAITVLTLLLVFYLALALLPLSWLHRRPASVNFAIWNSAQLTVFIVTLTLLYEPAYMSNTCLIEMIYSFTGFLEPFIILHTMRQDSLFWQGKYTDSSILGYDTCTSCVNTMTASDAGGGGYMDTERQRGHTSGNLNEVMLGVWEFGRNTMDVFAESITTLERKVVPIIPFGMIAVDTSMFFSGGTARVYKGKYDGRVVAVKFLFCIELTPERVADFCSEATLLNSVQHPNVVKCYGVSVMPPAICLITEFCDHGSLYDLMHSSDFVIQDALKARASLAGDMDLVGAGGRESQSQSQGLYQRYPSPIMEHRSGTVTTDDNSGMHGLSERTSGTGATDRNRISGFTFGGSMGTGSAANSTRNSNSLVSFPGEGTDVEGDNSRRESSFAPYHYSANDIVIGEDSSSQVSSSYRGDAPVNQDEERNEQGVEEVNTSTTISDVDEGDTSVLSAGAGGVDVSVLGPLPDSMPVSRRSLPTNSQNRRLKLAYQNQGDERGFMSVAGGIEEEGREDDLNPNWHSNSDLCSSIVEALDSMHSGSALSSANSHYGSYRINPLHAHHPEERSLDDSSSVSSATAPATAFVIDSKKQTRPQQQNEKSPSLMEQIGLKVAIVRRDFTSIADSGAERPSEAESRPSVRDISVDMNLTSHASYLSAGNSATYSSLGPNQGPSQGHVQEAASQTAVKGTVGMGEEPSGSSSGRKRRYTTTHRVMQKLSSLAFGSYSASSAHETEAGAGGSSAIDGDGANATSASGGFSGMGLWSRMLGLSDKNDAAAAAAAGSITSANSSASVQLGPGDHPGDHPGDTKRQALVTASHVHDRDIDEKAIMLLEEGGMSDVERISEGSGGGGGGGYQQANQSRLNSGSGSGTANLGDLLLTRQNSTNTVSTTGRESMAFSSRQRSQDNLVSEVNMEGRASRMSVAEVLPFSLRLSLARDCAAGVASLHAKGIMHNDIKSLNFLVDKNLRVKLADLGESRKIPETGGGGANRVRTHSAATDASGNLPSSSKMLPQSINWSAPEVLRGQQDVSAAADVWSLTMVIAEILTGEVPFDNHECRQLTLNEFLDELENGLRVPLPLEAETKHPWLISLLARGWAYQPEQRCTSIEMIGEIERHLGMRSGGDD